jgi:type II restriction/modification system DNA methylase subunit YeeA
MVLPPCHNFFNFTQERSFEERLKLETDNEDFIDDITSKDWIGVKQIAEETLNEKRPN